MKTLLIIAAIILLHSCSKDTFKPDNRKNDPYKIYRPHLDSLIVIK